MKNKEKIIFVLKIVAGVILLQTLFFKFNAAPESKYIFSELGVEPWGRWFAGFSELIAVVSLFIPVTEILGALAAVGIMFGALLSHLFILGIVVQNDGGLLFVLALIVMICSALVLYLRRDLMKTQFSQIKRLLTPAKEKN